MMNVLKALFTLAVLGAAGAATYVYLGLYPIGADVPHTRPVYWLLETAREQAQSLLAAKNTNHINLLLSLFERDSAVKFLAAG